MWKTVVISSASVVLTLLVIVGIAWAADIFTVDKDGTVRLVITDTGNVGIGTATPSRKLEVRDGDVLINDGTSSAAILLKGESASGPYTDIALGTLNDNKQWILTHRKDVPNLFRILYYDGASYFSSFAIEPATPASTLYLDSSGSVGIGTSSPATSAKLDVSSTTGALLIPRLTTAERDALTAANGMIIYNTSTNAFNFRENGTWVTK